MKNLVLSAIFSILSFVSFAQQNVTDAFLQSYTQESTGNYVGAATSIASVYNKDSYEHNLRLGYLKYMSGSYTEAAGYYLKAIDLMPSAIEPKIGYTLPLAASGKWDEVMEQYNLILNLDPNNTLVNYKLGYIYYVRKNYTEAQKYFEKVTKLYPFDYSSSLMLGWTYFNLGKKEEAKYYFNRVILNSPTDKSAKEGLELLK